MCFKLSKKAQKTLNKANTTVANKIIERLEHGKLEKLTCKGEVYRMKVFHYRAIVVKQNSIYIVKNILTKSDATFHRTGCYH